jgi:hypothetical protein
MRVPTGPLHTPAEVVHGAISCLDHHLLRGCGPILVLLNEQRQCLPQQLRSIAATAAPTGGSVAAAAAAAAVGGGSSCFRNGPDHGAKQRRLTAAGDCRQGDIQCREYRFAVKVSTCNNLPSNMSAPYAANGYAAMAWYFAVTTARHAHQLSSQVDKQ